MSGRPLRLPRSLRRRVEHVASTLLHPAGAPRLDFSQPRGEPALLSPDSVSWRVFKNPATLFIGGVVAVLLELAEPRVRSGVWQFTGFRERPRERLQRTGLAALMTVYGPRTQAEAMIAAVVRRHAGIEGVTPCGRRYRANDVELLDWVHATASFGFLAAHEAWLQPLPDDAARDRYYGEGRAPAMRYGACGAPGSVAGLQALFDSMRPRLEASPIVLDFLRIMRDAPMLPAPLGRLQPLLVKAAVETSPPWLRERLGLLDAQWALRAWQRRAVRAAVRTTDRLLLRSSPPVQACRRLGLPDDWLYR